MGIDRDTLKAIELRLRPVSNRVANMIARGVVQLSNDSKDLQLLQIDGFDGGPADDSEHFQPYGFSSVPLAGAEAIVIFPNGDRAHPIVIAVSDRRYRPTDGEPGEVTVYNHTGAKMTFTKDGDIIAEPAPGRDMLVRSPGGTAVDLALKSDVQSLRDYVRNQFSSVTGHVHATPAGPTTTITTVATPGTAPTVSPSSPAGTTVLKGE